jgi:antirestriction protein ArdC
MKTTTKNRSTKFSKTEVKEDKFISKILEVLDEVQEQDWEKYANIPFTGATNLFTKKTYKGFNLLALFIDTVRNNYKTSFYATFNSISKAGGKLKKGSKGMMIEFFSYIFKHSETKKIYKEEELIFLSKAELDKIEKIACVKTYTVFNSELIENFQDLNIDIIDDEEHSFLDFEEQVNCENFINKIILGDLVLKFSNNDVAFYNPRIDYVSMPEKKYFISEEKYYSTLFHEIIHWTGNEKRLDRNLKGSNDIKSYSHEELIAEMGSMLICLQFGITGEFLNSVRYLKHWSNANKNNRIENIKNAFNQSKRAKKFLEKL